MSQLTSPVSDSPDRPGRLRIRDRLRRAVQEMNSAPLSPELRILAFSRYYSPAGPHCARATASQPVPCPRCNQRCGKRPSAPPGRATRDDRRFPARQDPGDSVGWYAQTG